MQDIRFATRALLRTPLVTGTAVLIMALGIGATTAIFSIANAVLLRPLPFADPDRLVQLGTVGIRQFQAYRDQGRSFESLVSWAAADKTLLDGGEPERINVIAAERGLFDLLGVRPVAGRGFAAGDPANVAVVSEALCRRRFGGGALPDDGKIVLDQQPYTVVGVMPDSFQFPYRAARTDVWIPADLPRTESWSQRIDVAVGRLRPGVTLAAAGSELRAIAERIQPLRGSNPQGDVPMTLLTEAVVARSRSGVLILMGAAAMVLLIACANVATLLLVRGEGRRQEVAVRTALGASRARLFRQFLTESVLLALTASVAAVFVALIASRVLRTLAASQIPRASAIGLDWGALLFLLAVTVCTGLAFGIVPALQVTGSDASGMLTAASGRTSRGRGSAAMRQGLVVVEVALAFVLLTGAGLLLRAWISLEGAPAGIVAEHVLTLRLETTGSLQVQGSRAGAEAALSPQGQYFRAIEARVSQLPGVRAAGFVTRLHVQSPGNTGEFTIAGQPTLPNGHGFPARLREASPGYFQALGIPVRAGRLFTDGTPGIVVNEALVRRHFPAGTNPIGHVLDRGTIIAVVGDVRQRLRIAPEPEIYRSIAGTGYSAATLVVSGSTPLDGLASAVRTAIHEINPKQAVFDVKSMDQVIRASHADLDLLLWLISGFAGLAFVLSVAGIYGVVSHAVAARRQEFGIRLALGAGTGSVIRIVLAQGGRLIGGGVAIGVAGALGLTRFLQTLLYEVTPTDPVTFAVVALSLVAVALAACLNPARRVTTLDPMSVLRHE